MLFTFFTVKTLPESFPTPPRVPKFLCLSFVRVDCSNGEQEQAGSFTVGQELRDHFLKLIVAP